MSDIRELLEQARRLGQAIAGHPHVRAYFAAQADVDRDPAAQQLLAAYTEQARRIRDLERQMKPVEVADKRKLAECEQKLAGNPALKALLRAQADYVALMNQVNRAMEEPLAALGPKGGGV